MNTKTKLLIMIILWTFISIVLDLPHKDTKPIASETVKTYVDLEEKTDEVIEIIQPVIPIIDATEGVIFGALAVSRVMITPIQQATHGMALTFNLEEGEQSTQVMVVDELNQLVGSYEAISSQLEVVDDERSKMVYVYKVVVDNLESGSQYHYWIQVEELSSLLYEFDTLPEEATTIGFFGDTQGYLLSQYEAFANTYKEATEIAGFLDLCILAGDIVDKGDNWAQWSYLETAMSEVFSHTVVVSPVGNHDVYGALDIFLGTFNFPKNGVEGLNNSSYYFDLPYGRVAIWNTERLDTFDSQGAWLQDIMEETDQFKIVVMHRSAYPMAYDEVYIRNLSAYFEAAGIDLVLSGHDHIYSRTTMLEDIKTDLQKGVTYIVGGSSTGSKFYSAINPNNRYWQEFVYDEDNPVFVILQVKETEIQIDAYAIEGAETVLIDTVTINH